MSYSMATSTDTFGVSPRAHLGRDLVQWIDRSPATPYLLPGFLLGTWQIGSTIGWIDPVILPAPADVLKVGWEYILNGTLAANLAVSTLRALTGLVIGGILAFVLGLLCGTFLGARRMVDPTLQMVRTIPHLAMLPLIILWFGVDETAKIILVAWGVFFPIYLNTFHGVVQTDRLLLEMGQVYGMPRLERFRRIVLPGAMPSVLVGLRYSLGIMWLTLIVAETIAANSGIGHMASRAREFSQTDVIVLSIFVYAALGKLADSSTRFLEHRMLRWNPAIQEEKA